MAGRGCGRGASRLHCLVVTMSCISSSMLIRLRCLDRQAVDTLALTKKKIAKRHKKIAKRPSGIRHPKSSSLMSARFRGDGSWSPSSMLAPLEPGCRDRLGRAAKTLRSELVAERALARGMDPEERPDQAAPPGLTMRCRRGLSLTPRGRGSRYRNCKDRNQPKRANPRAGQT